MGFYFSGVGGQRLQPTKAIIRSERHFPGGITQSIEIKYNSSMPLILFDFDGVLADTLGDLLQFGQEACDELGVRHTATQDDLNSLEIMSFATYGQQMGVPENLVDEFVRRCLAKFAEKQSPPEIFEGLTGVVKELSASNGIAIITGNSSGNVKAFLAKHGLEGCVRAIYGVDMPGSKVEKIRKARSQFSADNEVTFMVGDSASDVRAAKEAGVKSIAVTWGHQSAETLVRAQPDYLVRSPGELREIINE
jgi:phosphoglycolate phosphatase